MPWRYLSGMQIDELLRALVRDELRKVVREEFELFLERIRPTQKSQELLSVQQVAEELKVSTTTVRGWVSHSKLRVVHVGRQLRVSREALCSFLENNDSDEGPTVEDQVAAILGERERE
jgi:excisionase family DNA binding protein